jgi:antitoxin Phd
MESEPHDTHWQVQEAKQRFSEVLRRAQSDGPQIITRHGEEVAVIIEATEFHRLASDTMDFKEFLRSGPSWDDLDLTRPKDPPREIDWTDSEE